jgi:hypothetical protein
MQAWRMSRAEAKLARRSLLAVLQAAFILLFVGLSLSAYNAHDAASHPTASRPQKAIAHAIGDWPVPGVRVHVPRHVAGEEGTRVRVKLRAGDAGTTVAKRLAIPMLPVQETGRSSPIAWPPIIICAAYPPRPYDPQGPPQPIV